MKYPINNITQIIITLLLLIIPFFTQAQNDYYYHYDEKIYLDLDKSSINIFVDDNFEKSVVDTFNFKDFDIANVNESSMLSTKKTALLEFENELTDEEYYQNINTLKNIPSISYITKNYRNSSRQKCRTSLFFYVKLKQEGDYELLQQKALEKNTAIVNQVNFMPLWYILQCTDETIENVLDIANNLNESGLFQHATPDLMLISSLNCKTEPSFNQQWGLKNAGQFGGDFGVDINPCPAWDITEGNQDVLIGVIDSGIELDHIFLENVIYPISHNTNTSDTLAPSTVYTPHGTAVAGIIGTQGSTVGIASDCQLMSVSLNPYGNIPAAAKASGITWAKNNGASILNCSWGSSTNTLLSEAILTALDEGRNGLGCIVVCSAGNYYDDPDDWDEETGLPVMTIGYPSNIDDRILSVGAITQCIERKVLNSQCIDNTPSNLFPVWGSMYGLHLDVVAPGLNISTTDVDEETSIVSTLFQDGYGGGLTINHFVGTSSACPHVSGLAGLILAANPCLSVNQVNNIIETTAQKVGNYNYGYNINRLNGDWNEEMGYGLINLGAAVEIAQAMNSSSLDLMIKDSPTEFGIEPNEESGLMWLSHDIWIRNQPDGIENQTHQNPEYETSTLSYVYVRITNKSCVTSTENDELKVYWAKNTTPLSWPTNWNGTLYEEGELMGNIISTVNIPILEPGEETIIQIPWDVPNPSNYESIFLDPFHFSLMARIVSDEDPMTIEENDNVSIHQNVRNNNNIAWKNVKIVDLDDDLGVEIVVGNPRPIAKSLKVELYEIASSGKKLNEESEISYKLDDILYQAWVDGGKMGINYKETNEDTKKIATDKSVLFENLLLAPNTKGILILDFNFLTKELTGKTEYLYHVVIKDTETDEILGGQSIIIRKPDRDIFTANAGEDHEILQDEILVISAQQINEAAIYNWYDPAGNLIFTGKDLQVTGDVTKKYKLEIIANIDGYKDYDEIEVKIKSNKIISISPNPASSTVSLNYYLNNVSSAYIMAVGSTNGTSNNYILDITNTNIEFDISNYQFGYYTFALVCDGTIVDVINVLKQ